MAIKAQCSHCGKWYKVPDQVAGKSVKCKACGHAFTVVAGSDDSDLISPDELTEVSSTPATPTRGLTPQPTPRTPVPPPPPPMPAPAWSPPPAAPIPAWPQPLPPAETKNSSRLWWMLGIGIGAGVLLLVCAGGFGLIAYLGSGAKPAPTAVGGSSVASEGPGTGGLSAAPADPGNTAQPANPVPQPVPANPFEATAPRPGSPVIRPTPAAVHGTRAPRVVPAALIPPPKPKLWDVPADLLAATPPASAPSTTTKPAGPFKPKTNLTIASGTPSGRAEIAVPQRLGRYVIIYVKSWDSAKGLFDVWDLQEGKTTFRNTLSPNLEQMVVSPDGLYLAGYQRSPKLQGRSIEVYSLKSLNLAARIDPTAKSTREFGVASSELQIIDFGAPHQLVAYVPPAGTSPGKIVVKDFRSAKTVEIEDCPSFTRPSDVALSPNGKLLAWRAGDNLFVFDLVKGKKVGHTTLPAYNSDAAPDEPFGRDSKSTFRAMAVSPDGTELAALFSVEQAFAKKARIVVWSLADGTVTTDRIFQDPGHKGAGWRASEEIFEWLPDGKGFLAWHGVLIDRGSFCTAAIPQRQDQLWLQPVDNNTCLFATRTNDQVNIATDSFPIDQLAAQAEAIAFDQKGSRAALPNAAATDESAVKRLNLLAAKTGWSLTPPAPPLGKDPVRQVDLRARPLPAGQTWGTANDNLTPDDVTAILFAARDAGHVIVEHTQPGKEHNFQKTRRHVWLERYNLATGAPGPVAHIPRDCRSLDVSPDGSRVLLYDDAQQRLDLIALKPDEGYEHVAGFLPYSGLGDADSRDVAWAGLLDNTHVLTLSGKGALVLWELPACKALWRSEDLSGACLPALSPDRKLAALAVGLRLFVFDPLTGAVQGNLALPVGDRNDNWIATVGFSPDQTQLAAFGAPQFGGTPWLYVIDLPNGKITHQMPLQNQVRGFGLTFPDRKHVLLGSQWLISLQKQAAVWNYTRDVPVVFGATYPYEQFFYSTKRSDQPMALLTAALPTAHAADAEDRLRADTLCPWHPGMSVRLDIQVAGDESLRQKAVKEWTEALQRAGFTVDDKAAALLTARTYVLTGPPSEYNMGQGERVTVTNKTLGHTITLSIDGQGQLWKDDYNIPPGNDASLVIQVRRNPGESWQAAADRLHPAPTGHHLSLPPRFIVSKLPIAGSRLTANGEVDTPGNN